MNYSSFNEVYDINDYGELTKKNNIKEKSYTADKLLNDYNNLNEVLKFNLDEIKLLEQNKAEILKYKSNVFINHQDIMIKLYNENENEKIEELNNLMMKYLELLKIFINNWINNHYTKRKEILDSDINNQEEELASFRKLFIDTTTGIIKTEKINKNICPICFENEINMCAIPCGHTCCNECIMQSIRYHNMRVTKCLSCRNNITEYIKMYIQL